MCKAVGAEISEVVKLSTRNGAIAELHFYIAPTRRSGAMEILNSTIPTAVAPPLGKILSHDTSFLAYSKSIRRSLRGLSE